MFAFKSSVALQNELLRWRFVKGKLWRFEGNVLFKFEGSI